MRRCGRLPRCQPESSWESQWRQCHDESTAQSCSEPATAPQRRPCGRAGWKCIVASYFEDPTLRRLGQSSRPDADRFPPSRRTALEQHLRPMLQRSSTDSSKSTRLSSRIPAQLSSISRRVARPRSPVPTSQGATRAPIDSALQVQIRFSSFASAAAGARLPSTPMVETLESTPRPDAGQLTRHYAEFRSAEPGHGSAVISQSLTRLGNGSRSNEQPLLGLHLDAILLQSTSLHDRFGKC